MIIWIKGGIGNVLFQLFYAQIVFKRENAQVEINTTLVSKNFFTKIIGFKIHNNELLERVLSHYRIEQKNIQTTALLLIKLYISKHLRTKIYNGIFYQWNKNISFSKKIKVTSGYFQNKSLIDQNREIFNNYVKEIRKLLNLELISNDGITIHFRGLDARYPESNLELEKLIKNINSPRIKIITDDPVSALSVFKNYTNKDIESNNLMSDFRALCGAQTLICSDSTFSWWAAHIGEHDQIYMPKRLYDMNGYFGKAELIQI